MGEIGGSGPATGVSGPCHWRFYLRRRCVSPWPRAGGGGCDGEPAGLCGIARCSPIWRGWRAAGRAPDPISTARILCCRTCWPSRWRPSCRGSSGEANFALQPVGTGPLSGERQRPAAPVPQAFDDYSGCGPARRIDIWMLPELAERLESPRQAGQRHPGAWFHARESRTRVRLLLPAAGRQIGPPAGSGPAPVAHSAAQPHP